jgi:tetratricopeptide (TPR) repeat protein
MNENLTVKCALGVLLLQILLQRPAFGQTTSSDWIRKGLDSRNIAQRIAAFERAAELDPNDIEALYYLGRAYKENAEYDKANVALNKAYFKNPYALTNILKTKILYELGTVYSVLDKKTEALDAFRSAKDLAANDGTARSRICYELGLAYIREGEYEKALRELREGKSLAPLSAALFDESMALAESKKSLNEQYDRASDLITAEKYEQAIALLNGIVSVDGDFKDARTLLQKTERLNSDTEKNKRLYYVYAQAKRQEEAGQVRGALRDYLQIAAEDPGFQDVDERIKKLSRGTHPNTENLTPATSKREPDLENTYQQGVAAFQAQQWRQAAAAFAEVRRFNRNYKDVAELWNTTRTELAQQDSRFKLQRLYSTGIAQIQKKQWAQARTTLEQIASQDPEYRDTMQLLSMIDESLAPPPPVANIDSLYDAGIFALQNGNWSDAVRSLQEVTEIDERYKDVANHLADARFNLQRSQRDVANTEPAQEPDATEQGQARKGIFLLTSATVSMIVLPLVGMVIFSPMTRARLYLIKGNYEKAAAVYLRLLQKRPDRIALYARLAKLYLLEGRRDDVAMQVYESVLKLDIFTEQRPQINSIVAQHYLAQGRTDEKAIEVMERELTASISKS